MAKRIGFRSNRDHPFGEANVRDMLCITYYAGKIRYRGMTVRPKGVSFRSTPPRVSEGKHEAIISEDLWRRSRAVRPSRWATVKSIKKTVLYVLPWKALLKRNAGIWCTS